MTNTRSYLAINASAMFMVFCLSAPSVAGQGSPQKENAVALAASAELRGDTNLVLRLKLTNTGSNTLSIPFGHLPWHRYAMSIALVQTDPYSTPIKQRAVIADPPPGEPHRISKGETLEGEIDLVDRFPGVIERLNGGDLIVFWSYQCPRDGVFIERVAGSLVISKARQ